MIYKSTKAQFQEIISKQRFSLDEFEFVSNSDTRYSIGLKENNKYYFIIDKSGSEWFYTRGNGDSNHPNQVRSSFSDLEIQMKGWLNLIKTEMSIVLHENKIRGYIFSDIIERVSERFSLIFNQASKAEELKLDEVCGMGFRKAFEFLIKDYLIYLGKMTKEEAAKEFKLQKCINYLETYNSLFSKLATHTASLGNDFSHYSRKLVDKDISDLKSMITILVDWIEMTERNKNIFKKIEDRAVDYISRFEDKNP